MDRKENEEVTSFLREEVACDLTRCLESFDGRMDETATADMCSLLTRIEDDVYHHSRVAGAYECPRTQHSLERTAAAMARARAYIKAGLWYKAEREIRTRFDDMTAAFEEVQS